VITGPGWASTTRTSTPKSLSFFSIIRLVISSVSDDTVSWRAWGPSSKSTCGSLESGSSVNSGFWRSLATRSLFGTSTSTGSINTGVGWCSSISTRSSCSTSSRSRAARAPAARSSAISRFSRRDSTRPSIQAPTCSATWVHEKRNTSAAPNTVSAIQTRPEPVKPSHCTLVGPPR
jgi:hypothetical protein